MGLVLYELVTGKRPFSGETPIELMRAHVYEDPLPFEQSDPAGLVPEDVRQMVFKALRKNRDERFATAQEFDTAVAAALAHVDRQFADEEGPTIILGAKTQVRRHEPAPTPSAQDRLDFQFAPLHTPTATTPMPPVELAERAAQAQRRQQQELEQVREAEGKGDRATLQRLLDAGDFTPAGAAELRSALERLAQQQAAEAKRREEADWSAARNDGSLAAWERYLASHRESSRRAEAEQARDEARDFESAASHDTEGSWRSFLERWHSGARVADASQRLRDALRREETAWKAASEDGTAGALLEFLNAYSSGKHHHEAEGLLRELAELDAAATQGAEGYQRFLKNYPTSRHARTVRHRLRELEERLVLAQIQKHQAELHEADLEKLLLTYPPGSTVVGTAAAEALVKIREEKERRRLQAEEEEWLEAKAASREEDWKRFLKRHPDSRHAEEGRRGLALAIENRQRAAEEHASQERIRQLEASEAEADLAAIVQKQPKGSALGGAAAAALERLRAEHERRRNKAEESEWLRASAAGEDQWRRFVETHADSPFAEEARRKLAQAAEAKRRAKEETALLAQVREHEAALADSALERLIRTLPDSADTVKTAAAAALARVAEELARREKQSEEEDWTAAATAGGAADWQRFIDRHGSSARLKQATQKLARAEKDERARTKTAERARARAQAGPPGSRRSLLIAGAAAAIAIAGFLLLRRPAAQPQKESATAAPASLPTAAPQQAERPTAAPPSPVPAAVGEPGILAFNALPWGRVDRIVDASGKNWNDGLPQYTPVSLRLPAGRYTLTVSNPDYASGLTVEVEVRTGGVSTETGSFETMDAKAYFRSQGWGG